MKVIKGIPTWAILLILLFVANLAWLSFNWSHNTSLRVAAKQFTVALLHTNNVSGIGIMDVKTGELLWAEWDFNSDGKPDEDSYFFQGRDVFNVNLKEGQPPKYDVYFYGRGKSVTWWLDRGGGGSFTDRIFYNTDGNLAGHEIWYKHAWYTVEKRGAENGIVVDSKWIQPKLGTNGMWTIETPTNALTNE